MSANAPKMDAHFARWYADAFMDSGETREARWKAVAEIATTSNNPTIEVLVRLAYATKAPPAGRKNEELAKAHAAMLACISRHSDFDANQSMRELQILAAATLVQMFACNADAALAVSTASFAEIRRPELPMNLAALAEQALQTLSNKQHVRIDTDSLLLEPPTLDFTISEEALQTFNAQIWKGVLGELCEHLGDTFSDFTDSVNDTIGKLTRRVALGDEELQMLWWLTSGVSAELKRPFNKINAPMRPLILGKELGRMTTISPGPASIGAMLSRAGLGTDKVKLQDAVNSVDVEWAATVSSINTISPVTTPIHFALEKRNEVGSTEAWQAGWEALTGLSAGVALPASKLGELFYREHLFLQVDE